MLLIVIMYCYVPFITTNHHSCEQICWCHCMLYVYHRLSPPWWYAKSQGSASVA